MDTKRELDTTDSENKWNNSSPGFSDIHQSSRVSIKEELPNQNVDIKLKKEENYEEYNETSQNTTYEDSYKSEIEKQWLMYKEKYLDMDSNYDISSGRRQSIKSEPESDGEYSQSPGNFTSHVDNQKSNTDFTMNYREIEHENRMDPNRYYPDTTVTEESSPINGDYYDVNIVKDDNLLKCEECGYVCKQKAAMRRHRKFHKDNETFECEFCDFKSKRKQNLKAHVSIHSAEKPYACSLCPYTTRLHKHLMAHSMVHSDLKPHKCSVCEYRCKRKEHLKIHMVVHSEDKPFACTSCDFRCNNKQKLRLHDMTHTGIMPYHCDQCPYKSGQFKQLKRHRLVHSEERPFSCDECQYTCKQLGHLKNHKMTHSDCKPFACDRCEYRTKRATSLKYHKMVHDTPVS